LWLGGDRLRGVVLRQFEPARGVRDPHHRDLASHVLEPYDVSRPSSLDRHPAFQLHSEFGEEGDGGVEVVDDDADVVHALNRHAPRIGAGSDAVGSASGHPYEPAQSSGTATVRRVPSPESEALIDEILLSWRSSVA